MYISQTARYAESLPLHLDQPLSHGGGPREQQRKRRVYTAHRILYGRSLEAKGRFLDAAVRYFDIASSLSTWLGVREDSDGISIDEGRETDYSEEEEDTRPLFLFLSLHPNELSSASSSALRPCSSISFLSLLQEAINCCILSPANPFKARLLRSLTQDRRFLHNIHRLDHVDLLQAMERKSFVSFQDVSAVATDTVVFHAIHQKEEEKKKKKESEKETESGEESAIHSVVKLAVLTNSKRFFSFSLSAFLLKTQREIRR
ncbi:hypothetical protein CSUI_009180 [Cystoisospora suis]|uniref:Uncharacterized protein n=1 Tax=Cystoisospora suis TaxID=483139 RepID=A0A2C6KKT6_9APIC|nr:hypothetical protein CSUI_009180 [Cystoisospora suis]